jgi:hypothetical protein
MGLLYILALWSNKCVIRGFGSIGFVTTVQPFPMVRSLYDDVISWWGHSGLDLIVSLMLRTVCYAMAGALALYYRSLGITSTLLRMGNISGRIYY